MMLRALKFATGLYLGFIVAIIAGAADLAPQPGDVYREFYMTTKGARQWRVTDPNAGAPGAKTLLPNPVLEFQIDDLKDAIRAEALVDRWSGHAQTANKRIRFNGGDWILLPEVATTPAGLAPETFIAQDNPVVEVPLDQLKEGLNTVDGTAGVINKFFWGQWGMYAINLRVYYDPEKKEHLEAKIISPSSDSVLSENSQIVVETSNDSAVKRVDVIGDYYDYDYDGDGVFKEWVESWHSSEKSALPALAGHIGSMTQAPFSLVWDTAWLPDQEPKSIRLIARVQNKDGVWSVSEEVTDLTLERKGYSVQLNLDRAFDPFFSIRADEHKVSKVELKKFRPSQVEAAKLLLRTWNGFDEHHEPLLFNDWKTEIGGNNHRYATSEIDVPVEVLRKGDNVLHFHSKTKHHGLEVLWPGPMLKIRTKDEPATAATQATKPSKKKITKKAS